MKLMNVFILLILMSVLAAPTRTDSCTLEIGGETHRLDHIYMLRIPDPFDDNVRNTRLVCTSTPLVEQDFEDWITFMRAFQADDQRGVLIDFREHTAIATQLSWGEWSTLWTSSEIAEVNFEGTLGDKHMTGVITTDPPLTVFRTDVTWRVSATVDLEPATVW